MLLPSAFSCDSSQSLFRPQSAALFTSPPTSPPLVNQGSSIFATCRALQSMLSPPAQTPTQLPTPPMSHIALPSNFKLRLRSHRTTHADGEAPRTRITKRAPPRGVNKRRRASDDDASRETDVDADFDHTVNEDGSSATEQDRPSTPKRLRLAPTVLPLGLDRNDFDALLDPSNESETSREESNGETEWTSEEDRLLVELVLEKLKLSKSDWQDCARSLGKDKGSVGRRWKSLMSGGEVGMKRSRRPKIHGTWR
jgi:hypothetical protein